MWTVNFYKSFFKNILLYMSSRLSKIRSVHRYVFYTPDGLFLLNLCFAIQQTADAMQKVLQLIVRANVQQDMTRLTRCDSLELRASQMSMLYSNGDDCYLFDVHKGTPIQMELLFCPKENWPIRGLGYEFINPFYTSAAPTETSISANFTT